ncbi:MAG: glycerate kinase [Oscillospiraceae bacterium]|jgi:hydroxypyruvate reductase|nr:glycerate kinase [Oscillospiraceae bacterium]
MDIRQDAQIIISESIKAVLPDAAVRKALTKRSITKNAYVVAIGKAAWRMASSAQQALGDALVSGVVITKYEHSEGAIPRMEIIEAGHPIPDENGILGTRKALDLVSGLTSDDTVIFLISGGGSALFELPLPGVSLQDIAGVTRQLLCCGANIVEINTVRKHLSAVKGGRFAQRCAPACVLSIVLSDVLGDSLDSIASGPAYPDASTCGDVMQILGKYNLTLPEHLRHALLQETPKHLDNAETEITGNVAEICSAAMICAENLGYTPLLLTTTLDCEARGAGECLAAIAREIKRSGKPIPAPCAIILGGETIVRVIGSGKGGRNQELALASAKGIDGLDNVVIFSVGSDGTDGPTDAAGGMVTGDYAGRCRDAGLSIDAYLHDNNAYELLKRTDGLIITGATGTNVNDLSVILCG